MANILDDLASGETVAGEAATRVERALIGCGPAEGAFVAVDANGAPISDALTFRKLSHVHSEFVDRSAIAPDRVLRGRYLFAGDYWLHFGHFLFESLSRLWWLDFETGPLDGIIFLSPRGVDQVVPGSIPARFLDLLGVRLPVFLVTSLTEVEELIVPRQACGLGAMSAGTPAHRRFLRNRLSGIAPRQGAERLYLSRQGYRLKRGGHFAESLLEDNLVAQGYTAFRPEKHSLEDQIAAYLGARQIVAPDSSALHLFGFLGKPDTDLAIVLRRADGAVDLLPQITGHTGRRPVVIDCIRRYWQHEGVKNETWARFAEVDFARLGTRLLATGFIDSLDGWRVLRAKTVGRVQHFMESHLKGRVLPGPLLEGAELEPSELSAEGGPPSI